MRKSREDDWFFPKDGSAFCVARYSKLGPALAFEGAETQSQHSIS